MRKGGRWGVGRRGGTNGPAAPLPPVASVRRTYKNSILDGNWDRGAGRVEAVTCSRRGAGHTSWQFLPTNVPILLTCASPQSSIP